MPHIQLDESLPGMQSLLKFRPEIAEPLLTLMTILMRGDEGLSKGERELIAAFVSDLNKCNACANIHGAISQCLISENPQMVDNVMDNYKNAPISEKLKALLSIAESVQKGGKNVKKEQIEGAKNYGSTDQEIHDTVLISSLFCLFNKYIDGLGLVSNDTNDSLNLRAKMIAEFGYSK
ncbi:MAG: peroxidase-related enzyme [Bacteroidota bacterium]